MNSIQNTEVDVHTKHLPDNDNANNETLNSQAPAESIVPNNGVTTSSFKDERFLLAKDLKPLISFEELLRADGHKVQHSGNYIKCCCPFHADRTPSFFIYEDDTHAKCYGCDWYGDIFKYEMDFHKVDFRTAWKRLTEFHFKHPRIGKKAKGVKKAIQIQPTLSDKQISLPFTRDEVSTSVAIYHHKTDPQGAIEFCGANARWLIILIDEAWITQGKS